MQWTGRGKALRRRVAMGIATPADTDALLSLYIAIAAPIGPEMDMAEWRQEILAPVRRLAKLKEPDNQGSGTRNRYTLMA